MKTKAIEKIAIITEVIGLLSAVGKIFACIILIRFNELN